MLHRSLRFRLALWALALLGVSQLLVSAALYASVSYWLENQVDASLRLIAGQVSTVIRDVDEPYAPLELDDLNFDLDTGGLNVRALVREQVFFVRLIDQATGAVVKTSADIDIPIITRLVPQSGGFQTFSYPEVGETLGVRVFTLPLTYAPRYALQVGISLEESQEIREAVLLTLAFLLLITIVLAPLSGWFLASRALVPVRAIARMAAAINETDLTRRLEMAAAENELASLVQSFNDMLARLEAAFLQQRQFTADAAHELRTPLSVMQAGLEVTLNRERTAAEYRAALESTLEESQRLTHLASSLLMLARADRPESAMHMEAVDLTLLLDSAAEHFSPRAEEKHITIERNIERGLVLQGDETRLIQLVLNLLDNAVKYTPEGGKVTVTAERKPSGIEMRFANTGAYIPPEDVPRIFERFYRLDQARSRSQGGFGLGLAIAKQIIDLHGGRIDVTSESEHGTRFTVTLPITR